MKILLLILLSTTLLACKSESSNPAVTTLPHDWKQPKWDAELRAQIRSALPSLELAKDITEWCPSYSTRDHVEVWAKMFVAIAYFESGYDPRSVYKESWGEDSLGLYQLSVPDALPWCKHTREDLFDPITNIDCAVPLMAELVERDKVVTAGINGKTAKGAARYWAVMRGGTYPGHKVESVKKIVLEYCK